MITGLLITAIFTVAFTMIAKRLSSTIVTAPMIFLGLGFLMSKSGLLPAGAAEASLHLVAEIALVILLFLDAAQIDLKALRQRHQWPLRMLALGLPLSILLGTLAAWLLLPDWPLAAIALLAAILAPTDAALGQAVISNPVVPVRTRRALTIESGLNDGLALPAILLFASLTSHAMAQDTSHWLAFASKQLLLGPLVGAIVGLLGGYVLIFAKEHKLTSEIYEGIGAIALAGSAYLGATLVDGNGFIAAFVCGLCFGHIVEGRCKFVFEFTEGEGQLLSWAAFFLIGLALIPEALSHLTWVSLAIIMTSLFVVRPLAIWLSLIGSDASPPSKIFFGWFGPPGLATALFALLVLPTIGHEFAEPILALAINAVWISAVLHGVTAIPGAHWYARRIAMMGDCAETKSADE